MTLELTKEKIHPRIQYVERSEQAATLYSCIDVAVRPVEYFAVFLW